MNITGIIKDAFLFPSKNIKRFAIYSLLSVLMVGFAFVGIIIYALGLLDAQNYLFGGIFLIISMLVGFIIYGYHIKVIKSGIEHDDNVPAFKWYETFMTGFDNAIVSLVYFIIPALIVAVVWYDTNVFGNAVAIGHEFVSQMISVYKMNTSINLAITAISNTVINFVISLAITVTVALIVFVIFSILQTLAEARLANTGSLREALDIWGAVKDLTRIGIGKVILVLILILVITAIIEIVFTMIVLQYLILAILYIILLPYLALFAKRALGLLYSDIV